MVEAIENAKHQRDHARELEGLPPVDGATHHKDDHHHHH